MAVSAQNQPLPSGERVVLGRRDRSAMTRFRWSGKEPEALNDVDTAEELGAQWKGVELVIYDYPGFAELLEYYESGSYLPDND